MFFLKSRKKVLVALSGGVDSSVAALLLKRAGFNVVGGFIRGYNVDGCQDRDAEDARLVAEKLDIPFYVFDFEEEYKKRVVNYLLDGYRKGITPNPDVVCNSQIKFGLFYDKVMELGFDYVASGHYSQLRWQFPKSKFQIPNIFGRKIVRIYEGRDESKNQSYFLWQIPYEKFSKILFPIGHLEKIEVRKIAKKASLPTADKKDSQGVCFLGKFRFDDFLKEHIKLEKGEIIDINGKKVGEHDGVWFYTIGQGHGLTNTAGRRFYVIDKDIKNNRLVVAYDDDSFLYCQRIGLTGLNFLDLDWEKNFRDGKKIKILVRTRYHQEPASAFLTKNNNGALVEFLKPEKLFPASGQSVVFYKKNGQMLGGGVIV